MDNNQVTALYQSILGKSPDPEGLAYWSNKLDNGMTAAQLANVLQQYATPGTPEYIATHPATNSTSGGTTPQNTDTQATNTPAQPMPASQSAGDAFIAQDQADQANPNATNESNWTPAQWAQHGFGVDPTGQYMEPISNGGTASNATNWNGNLFGINSNAATQSTNPSQNWAGGSFDPTPTPSAGVRQYILPSQTTPNGALPPAVQMTANPITQPVAAPQGQNAQPTQAQIQQAQQLYQTMLGRQGDPEGIQYYAQQLANGMPLSDIQNEFRSNAQGTYQAYAGNPQAYNAAHPGLSQYLNQDFAGGQPSNASSGGASTFGNQSAGGSSSSGTPNLFGLNPSIYNNIFGAINNQLSSLNGGLSNGQTSPTTQTGNGSPTFNIGSNGIPDYLQIAQQQQQLNLQNARQTAALNNPNYYGPAGSQVRTQNADGSYNITQSLNPQLQQNYDTSNQLQGNILAAKNGLVGNQLSYANAPQAPTFNASSAPGIPRFDTSNVSPIPNADANDLNAVRNSVYQQQTQYLDPQWQQAQNDLTSRLANQGITPGSDAYNREMTNFNLAKQQAYGDARNSAIQAGGAEQSRLFGIGLQANQAGQSNALNKFNTGLQANQAGINNALANFNTGMQSRQQGVSEANFLYAAPYNSLASLGSGNQISLPTYQNQMGTSLPSVNYLDAANMGFNANLGLQNANNAKSANMMNGLFGLGGAALQSGALSGLGSALGNIFGNGYNNWASNNADLMANQGISPSNLQTGF